MGWVWRWSRYHTFYPRLPSCDIDELFSSDLIYQAIKGTLRIIWLSVRGNTCNNLQKNGGGMSYGWNWPKVHTYIPLLLFFILLHFWVHISGLPLLLHFLSCGYSNRAVGSTNGQGTIPWFSFKYVSWYLSQWYRVYRRTYLLFAILSIQVSLNASLPSSTPVTLRDVPTSTATPLTPSLMGQFVRYGHLYLVNYFWKASKESFVREYLHNTN